MSLGQPLIASSSMSASDPFYAVRDALEGEVTSVKLKFDDWQSQLHSVNTASDTKFRLKHEEVKRDLGKADEMCRKVRLAVLNVERNRVKFVHIDDRELAQRKAFVDRLDAAVSNMRATFGSRETQGKLESDARKELSARVVRETDESARGQSAYTRANADFVKDQGGAQATIRREQDVVLDKMSSGLDTLKEMSLAIDAELKDQEKMIEDVDSGVDEAQGKMDGALKSIEKILKTKDKCQLATIFCLVVIFVIVTAVAVS